LTVYIVEDDDYEPYPILVAISHEVAASATLRKMRREDKAILWRAGEVKLNGRFTLRAEHREIKNDDGTPWKWERQFVTRPFEVEAR